ncbi:MAG: hypothetical protein R3E68_10080 [Burkholderiaceae bacterium]
MTIRILVWCPSQEGHLRYAHHLAEAAHQADAPRAPPASDC